MNFNYQKNDSLFRAGSHFERTVKAGDQNLELIDILLFVFEHSKYQTANQVKWGKAKKI